MKPLVVAILYIQQIVCLEKILVFASRLTLMPRPRKISSIQLQPANPKKASHPTRDKLLEVTVDLMGDLLPHAITSEMVLQKSGISRGSMYHHFQDFSQLLELAMVGAFTISVDKTIAAFTSLLHKANSKDEMRQGLTVVTAKTQPKALKQLRLHRARLISMTEDNPRLAEALATEQQRLTDVITDLIREAQERGWMNKHVDARSAAVLIQAYTLGKVVDDIVPNQMPEQAWNDLIGQIIEKVLTA
ncbi:MAG: TetR/AcrR family transcriptional regulator [Limnohabitans sp.]